MADNQQNTYAGGGGAIVAPTGNKILDQFTSLANVLTTTGLSVYGAYDSIREREFLRDLNRQNASNPPQQAIPSSQVTSPADYFSDPQRVQKTLFTAASLSLLIAGAFYLYKKA